MIICAPIACARSDENNPLPLFNERPKEGVSLGGLIFTQSVSLAFSRYACPTDKSDRRMILENREEEPILNAHQ